MEKELFTILKSLEYFRQLIQGNLMVVKTDSKNCICPNKQAMTRLERWKVLLNGYNIEVGNISGKPNLMADFLSRKYLKGLQYKTVLDQSKEEYINKVKQFCICDTDNNFKINDKGFV